MFTKRLPSQRIFYTLLAFLAILAFSACVPAAGIAATPQPDARFESLVTQPPQNTSNLLKQYETTSALINSLRFQLITADDQLSNNEVTCILQDDLGFLWVGTADGLNRYDGYAFVVYRNDPNDPATLSSNRVTALLLERDGTLWIGTDHGLNRFERETNRFTRFRHNAADGKSLASDVITALLQDVRGDIWIGTQGGGLDRLKPDTMEITHHTFRLDTGGSISSNYINDILEDKLARLWVATESGLNLYDHSSARFEFIDRVISNSQKVTSQRVRALAEEQSGLLWLGLADGGVERMEPVNRVSQHFTHNANFQSLSDNRVNDLLIDDDGRVWVATQSGIDLFDFSKNTFRSVINAQQTVDIPSGLDSYAFSHLAQDKNGLIWAGNTASGLVSMVVNAGRFLWLKPDGKALNAPHSENVLALLEDGDGTLWMVYPDGIDRFTPAVGRFAFYPLETITGRETTALISAFLDTEKKILVGSERGFYVYDGALNNWSLYAGASDESGASTTSITNLPIIGFAQIRPSEYWLATRASGLIRLDLSSARFSVYRNERGDVSSLSADTLSCVLADANNTLWVGTTNSGLNRFNNMTGGFVHYAHNPANPQSLSDNAITSMLKDSQGRLWIGTASGLNLLLQETGVFQRYGSAQGMAGENIRALVEDGQSAIWISTDKGISRLDTFDGSISNFGSIDGLQSGKFNTGAATLLQTGLLVFGGSKGINIFDASAMQPSTSSPDVRITKLTQNGIPILSGMAEPITAEITLRWPRNYFDFEFTALSFNQPEKNQYAYKLEEFDQDWNWIGTRRFGGYTNLPGGEYMLRVMGANNEGVWNTQGATLRVHVIPAPWENTWLRLAAVLVIAAIVYSAVRVRLNNISRYNRQLAAEVKERTRDLEKRRRAAEGMREILVRLNSEQPLEESLTFIAAQAADLFNAQRVLIVETRGKKRARLAAGYPPMLANQHLSANVQEWLCSLLNMKVGTTKCEPIPDVAKGDSETIESCFTGEGMVCAAPVYPAGETFGGLVLCTQEAREISQEERDLLQTLADQVALAVESARLRAEARELAVVSERNRIARDLHDAVTQTLFSASLTADSIPAVWLRDRAEGADMLNNLRALNRSALAEMRTLLLELRPTAITRTPLKELLLQLANAFSGKTGITIDVDASEENFSLPEEVHVAFYRIAQEALTNAVKHAHACNIHVRLFYEPLETRHGNKTKVTLEIRDDGCGFNPEAGDGGRFGMIDMKERAQHINAQLNVESGLDKGTCIRVEWLGRVTR